MLVGQIKKILFEMSEYFHKAYEPFARDINIKVDLFNYAAKMMQQRMLQELIHLNYSQI